MPEEPGSRKGFPGDPQEGHSTTPGGFPKDTEPHRPSPQIEEDHLEERIRRLSEEKWGLVERQLGDFKWDLGKQAIYAGFAILAILFVAVVGILRLILPEDPDNPSDFIDKYGVLITVSGAVLSGVLVLLSSWVSRRKKK